MHTIKKKHTWALKLFVSLYLLSRLFSTIHWHEATLLILLSATILIVFYPLRYAAKSNKTLLDHIKMAWVITYCIKIFFQFQDFMPLITLQSILFFYWFVNEGFFYFDFNLSLRKNKEREQNILDDFEEKDSNNKLSILVDYLLILCGLLLVTSELFKLMHWSFATEMAIVAYGSFSLMIWFKKF